MKHFFETTGEAYDACQCDESLKDGDLLIIESEKIVGLVHTWPMAVTEQRGQLHKFYGIPTGVSVKAAYAADSEARKRGWLLAGDEGDE